MDLATRIKRLRIDNEMSYGDFAQTCGIARSYIYQLEHGSSSPTLKVLETIAAAFSMTPVELLAPIYGASSGDVLMRPGGFE